MEKDHLLPPAVSALSNEAQDTIHLVCQKGPLLVHVQLAVHQDPRFCQAALLLVTPQHVLMPEVVPPQGQGSALALAPGTYHSSSDFGCGITPNCFL